MQFDVPQCVYCRHFVPKRFTCPAFPDQAIPIEIVTGKHDHHEPFPGDHGIQFEPKPETSKPATDEATP